MSEKRRIARYSPEVDDFASRYDRMVATGASPWAVKVTVVVAGILIVLGVVSYLLA